MNESSVNEFLDIAQILDEPDQLSSGKLCLEFANTMDWHAAEQPSETLHSYQDLLTWAGRVGIVRTPQQLFELETQAIAQPARAELVYAWAIELRETVYRIFTALSSHSSPAPSDIARLNEALPRAYSQPELLPMHPGFGWRWRGDQSGFDAILWPILRSTARLLTDGDYDRIGHCADDRGCGYLFYDTSRNRSRRWCSMESCGNRAKSQRHYARHRSSAPA